MTILQIIPSLESGGVERGVLEINKALVKHGFESIVVSNGGKMVYSLKQNGGKHIKLNVKSKNPLIIWRNIYKLEKIIKENNVNIVHARSRAPAWSAYFACKRTGCKFITTVHGNYSVGGFLFGWLKRFYNSSMVRGDAVIVVSKFIEDYCFKYYKNFRSKLRNGDSVIIHRGVDVDTFNPDKVSQQRMITIQKNLNIPEDKTIILLPGRITKWKGQEYFLNVLHNIKYKNYLCIMLGDGDKHGRFKNFLENKIEELGLLGRVRLEPNISDISSLYMLSDVVISSSIRGEAFGRIAIEGQAMKKAVIATAIGGSLETIINGKTGWLVPENDYMEFAKVLDKVLKMDLEKKREIGEVARKHILDNFTTQTMCDKTIEVYKNLVKGRIDLIQSKFKKY